MSLSAVGLGLIKPLNHPIKTKNMRFELPFKLKDVLRPIRKCIKNTKLNFFITHLLCYSGIGLLVICALLFLVYAFVKKIVLLYVITSIMAFANVIILIGGGISVISNIYNQHVEI